jgi:hypothetical protein
MLDGRECDPLHAGAAPLACRRTAALRQRHARQLRQQDRDQFGVPVASSARPFSLWASPQKIGEACTGEGGTLRCAAPDWSSFPHSPAV